MPAVALAGVILAVGYPRLTRAGYPRLAFALAAIMVAAAAMVFLAPAALRVRDRLSARRRRTDDRKRE